MREAERIDWAFNNDVREKKKLANQARYRKRGSKSKKCNLIKTEAFIDLDNATQSPDMAMTEFTLSFSGNFNREMICNSLASMLPKGAPVKLDIKCLIML